MEAGLGDASRGTGRGGKIVVGAGGNDVGVGGIVDEGVGGHVVGDGGVASKEGDVVGVVGKLTGGVLVNTDEDVVEAARDVAAGGAQSFGGRGGDGGREEKGGKSSASMSVSARNVGGSVGGTAAGCATETVTCSWWWAWLCRTATFRTLTTFLGDGAGGVG